MIEIRYCGSCGDYSIIQKLSDRLKEVSEISDEDIREVECGSCSMEVLMEGETVFTEEYDFLDLGKVVEDVKSGLEVEA